MSKLERDYQAKLIRRIRAMFPNCMILKNDSSYIQGIPDFTILYNEHWAVLEIKASPYSPHQPNQDWYIQELSYMSFAAFIYPENEDEVLRDLQQAFKSRRPARVSQR